MTGQKQQFGGWNPGAVAMLYAIYYFLVLKSWSIKR